MFYSTQILTQKGALGIIWVAAHLDKQLKVRFSFSLSNEFPPDTPFCPR